MINLRYEWLDEYLLARKAATKDYKIEWGWDRYLVCDKMFGAICSSKEGEPIITIKCKPDFGELLRSQYSDIVPGYYMNKQHWNSVYLDGEVPDDILKEMIDQSYRLVVSSLSKKIQKELL